MSNYDLTTIIISFVIVGSVIYFVTKADKKAKAESWAARRAFLLTKYGSEEIVDNIMYKRIFTGETAEMLTDSLGQPVATDQQVLKTKTKDIWKYHPTGQNQYRTRITLENDVVVGWDVKER